MTAVTMQREIYIGLSEELYVFNQDGKERKIKGKDQFPIYFKEGQVKKWLQF